jgi:hypothetical protein
LHTPLTGVPAAQVGVMVPLVVALKITTRSMLVVAIELNAETVVCRLL